MVQQEEQTGQGTDAQSAQGKPERDDRAIVLKREYAANGYTIIYVLIPAIDPVRPQILALPPSTPPGDTGVGS